MGKGDQRTRRGKIFRGTFGKRRRKLSKQRPAASGTANTSAEAAPAAAKEPKVVKKHPKE